MVLVKKWPFFQLCFFQAIQARKMSFMIFQNEKPPFQAINTRRPKSRIIDVFPKGLTHGFGPKKAIFPTFFLGNIGQENVFYDIVERKRVNLHGFCPKMAIFEIFFQAIQTSKMSFTTFQIEKTSFQAIKTSIFKSHKIYIFLKGLVHGFCQKL